MRADHRADDVMRVADVGDPVADRFAGGVLQGAAAAGHGDDFGSQQLHAKHVQCLPFHVFLAHEYATL